MVVLVNPSLPISEFEELIHKAEPYFPRHIIWNQMLLFGDAKVARTESGDIGAQKAKRRFVSIFANDILVPKIMIQ